MDAAALAEVEGIIIDEYAMVDIKVWGALKEILRTYPLKPELRKANALAQFGYRDLIIGGICANCHRHPD